MWYLCSWPGIKPSFPALEGGFLTTGPPGKSPGLSFLHSQISYSSWVEFTRHIYIHDFIWNSSIEVWITNIESVLCMCVYKPMCVCVCVCVYIVLFSHSVMSESLQPHGWQHARLPCPSPSPSICSNSCSLSQWCHPTISSSVAPFSSCPQSSPASGSFPME